MPRSHLTMRARDLRVRETRTERRVWRWLRDRRMFGLKFRRQVPVGDYILDFYCAEMHLCVELDGASHDHDSRQTYDAARTGALSKLGIQVIRLRNDHVRRIPELSWDFIVGTIVKNISEKTGRKEMDLLRELNEKGSFKALGL